ncbi:5996_t:CDS:2 [Rhizophagus irregularis]|nr:5996_t:CDS:2 [Rhizophagus irregularis]
MASIYVKDQTVAKYLSSFHGIRASLKEESIYHIWKIKNRFFNNEAGNDDVDGMYIMPLPEVKD